MGNQNMRAVTIEKIIEQAKSASWTWVQHLSLEESIYRTTLKLNGRETPVTVAQYTPECGLDDEGKLTKKVPHRYGLFVQGPDKNRYALYTIDYDVNGAIYKTYGNRRVEDLFWIVHRTQQ
jgi:hypothetical protein